MLVVVTVAFLLGILAGAYLPYLPLTLFLILVLAAAALTAVERRGHLTHRRGLLCYGGVLSGIVYWTLCAPPGPGAAAFGSDEGEPVKIVGAIVEPVMHAPGRMVVILSAPEHAAGRLRVTWRQPDRVFFQGDRVEVEARLRTPSGLHNPGGFDYAEHLSQRGIDGVATVSGSGRIRPVGGPVPWSWWAGWHRLDEWRNRVREAATESLSEPALGLFLGMIIGESGYLTPAVRDAFMATGTVHILSISGSHLGLIALLFFILVKGACLRLPSLWLLALSRRTTPNRLAAAATVLPVTFYTVLAGAQVATVRSLIMILVFLLAVWLGRERRLVTALAFAALVVVIHDPHALFDMSFQLSFGSVLAIAMIVRWRAMEGEEEPASGAWTWDRFWMWLREYGWVTGGVTVATFPLVAYHFNQIAWLGPLGNLFVLPLAGAVLVPLGLGSTLWLLAAGGESLPAGSLNDGLFTLMFQAVQWLARVPGAEWHVASPAVVGLVGFYLALWLAIRPGAGRWARLLCLSVVGALLVWWAWSPRGWADRETLRVTFLDVGQGDTSVIELPDGQTVLIDGGAASDTLDLGRAVVAPFLWDRGIRRLDHVIGTHPQLDHIGGLPWVVRSFAVGRYWGNGVERDEVFVRRLQDTLRERGVAERRMGEGQEILTGGPCRFQAMNPPGPDVIAGLPGLAASNGKMLNNLSVVTRLDCGPHSFLFTGDVEAEGLSRMVEAGLPASARVVKVPHHGSKGSLDVRWMAQVRAEAAIISVGKHNPYGHPSPAVVAAYVAEGIRLYRTDRDGAVSVTASLSSPSFRVSTMREQQIRPAHPGAADLEREGRNLRCLWRGWMGWNA